MLWKFDKLRCWRSFFSTLKECINFNMWVGSCGPIRKKGEAGGFTLKYGNDIGCSLTKVLIRTGNRLTIIL